MLIDFQRLVAKLIGLKGNITVLAAVFENSPYGIVINRLSDGIIVAANPAFTLLSGYSEAEYIRKTPDELGFYLANRNTLAAIRTLEREGRIDNELTWCINRNGKEVAILYSSVVVDFDNEPYVISTVVDVTDRQQMEEAAKLDELRMQSLLLISQFTYSSMQELLDFALDEIVAVSSSEFGYIFHYSEKTESFSVHAWSSLAIEHCAVENPPHEYLLANTGLWGETVRQRQPIVINDYDAPNSFKKGFPSGHITMTRYMTLPVFVNDEIVAVVGVANKKTDYTDSDVRQLTLMMDSVWKIVKQKQALTALTISEEKYRRIVKDSPIGIFQTAVEGYFLSLNPALAKLFGCDSEEDAKQHYSDLSTTLYTSAEKRQQMLELVSATEDFVQTQTSFKRKDGSIVETELYIRAVRDGGKIQYLEGFIEDISQRVAAENEQNALEAHKRTFYRDTIMSVTDGKLEICDADTIEPYLTKTEINAYVCNSRDVSSARHAVEAICRESGIPDDKLDGLMIGVGEAITNSIKHAEFGIVRVGKNEQEIWIAVSDNGSGIESLVLPRAVLKRGFSTKPSMGLGYSIMLDSVDRMLLKTDRGGTTVVLIKSLVERPPSYGILPDTWASIPDF